MRLIGTPASMRPSWLLLFKALSNLFKFILTILWPVSSFLVWRVPGMLVLYSESVSPSLSAHAMMPWS